MVEHQWIWSRGKRLSAMVHTYPQQIKGTPVVICCHGFTGDKIGANQLTLHMASAIQQSGISVVRFDFAGSGESEGEFAEDTIVSGWQEDLRNVIDWVKHNTEFSDSPIILYGHSLGGLTILTTTTPWEKAIVGRIALAPVIYPVENFKQILLGQELWEKAMRGETVANFFNKGFTLHKGFFVKELLKQDYRPLENVMESTKPLLIVHGTGDEVVPIKGSEALYEVYQGDKTFHKLDGVDHVFTGNHLRLQVLLVEWIKTVS